MNKTEAAIQWLIWHRHHFGDVIPNVHIDPWGGSEVDALYLTTSGYAWFYEIKISRSDFLADLKKKRHQQLLAADYGNMNIAPKHFVYVVHGFDPGPDLPEYTGLARVSPDFRRITMEKYPPRLCNKKLTSGNLEFINKKVRARYLKSRHEIGRKARADLLLKPSARKDLKDGYWEKIPPEMIEGENK